MSKKKKNKKSTSKSGARKRAKKNPESKLKGSRTSSRVDRVASKVRLIRQNIFLKAAKIQKLKSEILALQMKEKHLRASLFKAES